MRDWLNKDFKLSSKKTQVMYAAWTSSRQGAIPELRQIFLTWHIRMALTKLDKRLLTIAKRTKQRKMDQYEEELDIAIRYAGSASQHRLSRSQEQPTQDCSHAKKLPSKEDLIKKCFAHPH